MGRHPSANPKILTTLPTNFPEMIDKPVTNRYNASRYP
jgi:hypothetical protein